MLPKNKLSATESARKLHLNCTFRIRHTDLDHIRTVVSRLQHRGPEPRSLPARPNSCYDN
jgi:hypothetical protein